MGRTKRSDGIESGRDKEQSLRGEINKAKKQIKQLQKENQRLMILLEHQSRPIVVRSDTSKKKTSVKTGDCPSCKEGMLDIVDLGMRQIHACKECGFRQVIKIDGKNKT